MCFDEADFCSAPEMLHNPYADNSNSEDYASGETIAKPSRKTDMYAFAILCWEVLTEQKPFKNVKNETALSSLVHQGQRPQLSLIPDDCPRKIVKMIEACWDSDRSKRKSAVECLSILQYNHMLLSQRVMDVYLSCDSDANLALSTYVFHRLSQIGLKVCLESRSGIEESHNSASSGGSSGMSTADQIANSKTFVLLANQSYQNSKECMGQLRTAKAAKPPRPIIPLFTEADYGSWISMDMKYLCQTLSPSFVLHDLSSVASQEAWEAAEEPSLDMIQSLNKVLEQVIRELTPYIPQLVQEEPNELSSSVREVLKN